MTKPPEEGEIWEWRAFGLVSDTLTAKILAHKPRLGVAGHRWTDVYLISDASEHNIKLRRWSGEWLLKFKLLLEKRPDNIELYSESATEIFKFPVDAERLRRAAELLESELPEVLTSKRQYSQDSFMDALANASPPVSKIKVSKMRSQFECEGGWIELADATFPARNVGSISIHSPEIEVVERTLEYLNLGPELEPMNYVEACRRWGPPI